MLAAMRLLAVLALIVMALFWCQIRLAKRLLVIVGAAISGASLWEWLRLMTAVNASMDAGATPRPMGLILIGFFLRLGLTLVVLYVSLKYLHGTVFALAAGIGLGIFSLTIEAVKLHETLDEPLRRAQLPSMPTQLLFTRFLNHHFAAQVDSLLGALHISSGSSDTRPSPTPSRWNCSSSSRSCSTSSPSAPRFRSKSPAAIQHLAEMTHEFVGEQSEAIIGHGYERFTAYLTVLVLFILIGNLMGLVPGLESPTANAVVPLGFALVTFFYYHYHGIRANGFGYIKQFLGPVWWLYPLMLPIEIISHFARVLSLTVRLYANMFAGDLVTLAFFSLIPVGVPLVFLGLHFGVAIIQAYVFMVLATVYLSLAVAHDH